MFHPVAGSPHTRDHHPDEPVLTAPPGSDRPREGEAGAYGAALTFQLCRWCRTPAFRRLLCPVCGATELERVPSSGRGVIRRLTLTGGDIGVPRPNATIAMDEGFRIRARIVGVPPEQVHVGALVQLATPGGLRTQELAFRLVTPPAH